MNVIPFPKKSEVKVILPNGVEFQAPLSKCNEYFDDPKQLEDCEKDGLIKLAIAILYADHHLAKVAIN